MSRSPSLFFLGLDFGTEFVRAVLVDADGMEHGSGSARYRHGVIDRRLPGSEIPVEPLHAFQHPGDWIDGAEEAVREAMKAAGCGAERVLGIGSDFTSCTILPVDRDGMPLCLSPEFSPEPHAWPKLWKHHGAACQAERMTRIAQDRGESFLERYGGQIGLEWFFPKLLETIERAPHVAEAAATWLEAGDWFVRRLTGELSRSTCQAGYKALWSADTGYPNTAYFREVHPALAEVVVQKLPGRHVPPGVLAGTLCGEMAERLGLMPGIAVSASIIDAHAGVPGAGAAEPGTLVVVLGTSSCHMLNSRHFARIPGMAGVVKDGILPGFHGYEAGQAAVGDAFDWLRRLCGRDDFEALGREASELPPGADGVRCLDWFHGCRTPLMDGHLKGAFTGLSLHHGPPHLFRALMEATACGLRWIVGMFRDAGVPVEALVATGGLPHHNPFIVQLYADVLALPIRVPSTGQGPALGAAILGALAAGRFEDAPAAIAAMTGSITSEVVHPGASAPAYDAIYEEYRSLAETFSRGPVPKQS